MVTAKDGLMTSNLSLTANRVLTDYKDAIQDYKVTDMPVISLFAERFTTETGGDVDITFAKPSMALEQIEEGDTPNYQHTDLRNERISVKEWGLAVGVTRRMLEDSMSSVVAWCVLAWCAGVVSWRGELAWCALCGVLCVLCS